MKKNTILIIEDDKEIGDILRKCMHAEGYKADLAHSGKEGLRILNEDYILLILDIMLPDMSGYEVCEQVRKQYNIPILMLTARDSEVDKVYGLRAGADDYQTKPFSLYELSARVQALIRRYTSLGASAYEDNSPIVCGKLCIDNERHAVSYNNNLIELTATEYKILYYLALNKGRVFTKKQIYEAVWDDIYAYDDNTIMVHIRRVRKKFVLYDIDVIETIRGIGYKLSEGL